LCTKIRIDNLDCLMSQLCYLIFASNKDSGITCSLLLSVLMLSGTLKTEFLCLLGIMNKDDLVLSFEEVMIKLRLK
jgi:hypothetical protein